jgi:hypothetical protein
MRNVHVYTSCSLIVDHHVMIVHGLVHPIVVDIIHGILVQIVNVVMIDAVHRMMIDDDVTIDRVLLFHLIIDIVIMNDEINDRIYCSIMTTS